MIQVIQHTQRGSFVIFHHQKLLIKKVKVFAVQKASLSLCRSCRDATKSMASLGRSCRVRERDFRLAACIICLTMVQYRSLQQYITFRRRPREKAKSEISNQANLINCWSNCSKLSRCDYSLWMFSILFFA